MTVVDRGYFFEGVFDKLQGMTYMPDRKFHLLVCLGRLIFCIEVPLTHSRWDIFSPSKSKALTLIDIQPYIPHIATMYAAGLQSAETIFCGVRIHRIVLVRRVDCPLFREK